MLSSNSKPRPVLLCILDGFGYREDAPDNAISIANVPVWQKVWQENPHALLEASGEDVGLPKGQMGNSEVGHMNLGAGRIVYQDLPMIDHAIESGSLQSNKSLIDAIENLKASGGTCHLMGLVSDGGVHSHMRHLLALAGILSAHQVPVAVHAFLDGRDVPPQSAAEQIGKLGDVLSSLKGVSLSTVCGRYYAMDRDNRWERIEAAYRLITKGEGTLTTDFSQAIEASYAGGVTDEFMLPLTAPDYDGIKDGDGILFFNFRTDRAREILTALLDPHFNKFDRPQPSRFAVALGMVEYSDKLNKLMGTLFPPKKIINGLGEVVAKAGLRQLRIAETEKYPHVTFFFNGGLEAPYEGEERIMVPSPKVATYDMQPEMSALEVTQKVIEAVEGRLFDLIVLNFANPDMVGHTGSLTAATKAVETIDKCLGNLLAAMKTANGVTLITADHGNCEIMFDAKTKGPHTAHTLSKVPVVVVSPDHHGALRDGRLADVAPTLLELLGLVQPPEMSGESLFVT